MATARAFDDEDDTEGEISDDDDEDDAEDEISDDDDDDEDGCASGSSVRLSTNATEDEKEEGALISIS